MSETDQPAREDQAAPLLQQAFAAHQGGRLDEAGRLYLAVLNLSPRETRALTNLGTLYLQLGRIEEAVTALDASLALKPDQPGALGNRAGALRYLGRTAEALASCEQAVALKPDFADGHNTRGLILTELGRPQEALAALDRAVELAPGQPAFWNTRGVALSALSRPDDALDSFERALALAPGFIDALSNRVAALRAVGRLDEALAACGQIIAAEPNHVDALVNRACVLRDKGRAADALASLDQALALQPQHVEAGWTRALLLLTAGDYAQGWPLFELRWRRPDLAVVAGRFAGPPWLGEAPLEGRTLLLHGEQGLGDSIQMLRYASLAAAAGARVVLDVPPALIRLARSAPGVSAAVEPGQALPPFDLHSPLMSMPLAFATRVHSVPWTGPYLSAPDGSADLWRARLGPRTRPRIGLAWTGNPRQLNDRNRSMPFAALEPLLAPGADWVSLHKEYAAADRGLAQDAGVADFSADLHDLADTAGLIEQMDLVISVCTSVAHLAGAMGKPVWILLSFAADFRWGAAGETTPWYPSARLFRQTAPGDWRGVIARVAEEIAALR